MGGYFPSAEVQGCGVTRREDLALLREVLLDALDSADHRDLAALSRELRIVTAELEADEGEQKGVSPFDELAARRAGVSGAEDPSAAGGGKNRRR